MIKSLLLASLMLVVDNSWGLSEARLLNQSNSGQTALFNLGIHDGVKEGDYAVIVKEIRSLDSRDLRIVPVAKARNIKINPDSSVWLLYKVYDAELLVRNQKFLILSESEMLRGRRDPRLGRITVVSKKGNAAEAAKNYMDDDDDELAKLKSKYKKSEILKDKTSMTDDDAELIDLEEWEKAKGQRYRTALYRSPNAREFRRELRLATFEKIVTGYLRKVNEPDFNYDQFYEEQMRAEFANEFRKNSSFETEYRSYVHDQANKATGDEKLYRTLLEKGDTWSEDFSDEELRSTLTSVSALQEKDRRKYVAANPNRYSLFLDYGRHFTDDQTKVDSYRRSSRYSVEMAFEVVPFVKHTTLERFTLDASARVNRTALESASNNSDVDETSLSLGANWYPLYAPYAIEAPVIFMGAYIRSGFARVTTPSLGEKGNYTLLSAPGFRAGMRYNLRNNIGLRIAAGMETLQLDRYESSKLGSSLPDSINVFEGKINFAAAYSF